MQVPPKRVQTFIKPTIDAQNLQQTEPVKP